MTGEERALSQGFRSQRGGDVRWDFKGRDEVSGRSLLGGKGVKEKMKAT